VSSVLTGMLGDNEAEWMLDQLHLPQRKRSGSFSAPRPINLDQVWLDDAAEAVDAATATGHVAQLTDARECYLQRTEQESSSLPVTLRNEWRGMASRTRRLPSPQ
jgi:hypothetical protein